MEPRRKRDEKRDESLDKVLALLLLLPLLRRGFSGISSLALDGTRSRKKLIAVRSIDPVAWLLRCELAAHGAEAKADSGGDAGRC